MKKELYNYINNLDTGEHRVFNAAINRMNQAETFQEWFNSLSSDEYEWIMELTPQIVKKSNLNIVYPITQTNEEEHAFSLFTGFALCYAMIYNNLSFMIPRISRIFLTAFDNQ